MTTVRGANSGKTALAVAQGSTMHIMDPKTLQILDSYPFKTPISTIASYVGRDPMVFILLRNLNFFVFRLPELVSYDHISMNNSTLATRRILPISSPFERGSTGLNSSITESIRFKERQFACAAHPQYIALSVVSGFIHIIPKGKPQFAVSVTYFNIVDLAFLGPTLYSSRLAILCDTKTKHRELHVVKIIGKEFEEEFSLTLPPDAYSIIPLKPETESTLVISTNNGVHRISAPIDLPLQQQPLSTFVSTVSLSHASMINELYLILDAEGGICVASFPLEGRPVVEKLSKTNAFGGSIIFVDDSIIVSSPFSDMISSSIEITTQGCNINQQARYPISGPIRHMFIDGKKLLLSNNTIRLYEKTISCRVSTKIDVGPVLHIFSAGTKLCLSYLNSSILLNVDDSTFTQEYDNSFISMECTLCFAECFGGILQVTVRAISVLGHKSMKFDEDVSCASSSDTLAVVATSNQIKFYELPSASKISTFDTESQVKLITTTKTKTIALLVSQKLLFFDKYGEVTNTIDFHLSFCFTSMVLINGDQEEVLIGTTDGILIHVKPGSEPIVESIGHETTMMHQFGASAICSGEPPLIIGKERIFIGNLSCRDIVKCNDNFVCLSENHLQILNAETPGGSSRSLFPIDDLVNFTILNTNPPKFVCHQGTFSVTAYVNQKEVASFVSPNPISFLDKVMYQGIEMIIVGNDANMIILLDENLTLITKRIVEALPTAATVINDFLVVANKSTIDFFIGSKSDENYELEKIFFSKTYCLTTALASIGNYLIVGDSNQAISVLKCTRSGVEEVDRDNSQRGISAIGVLGNFIFAADYSSFLACYQINEWGSLIHIGEFMADSRVLSFANWNNTILYGMEGGGIGSFFVGNDDRCAMLSRLSKEIDNEKYCFIDQRVSSTTFEWEYQNMIVDIDNLQVALNDPIILSRVSMTRDGVKQLLESFVQ